MKPDYIASVGLEVHVELCTDTKIFCGCKNQFGALPNTLCCPVCIGMPGALPVLNKQAVHFAVLMGHALNCEINNVSRLDRKHYFYPDLPKAYQTTQDKYPICTNGYLDIYSEGKIKRIGISRIHIEEDAGKLIHQGSGVTLADYNRSGVPLIEIVTLPDMNNAEQAKALLENIAAIVSYLGISDAKMQEGNIRADVNVSVRKAENAALGVRTEMKNINSFSGVYRSVLSETQRQISILNNDGEIEPETRRWDDIKNTSITMRTKQDSVDYMYFKDPDTLPFIIPGNEIAELKKQLPELPFEKCKKYIEIYGLTFNEADLISKNKQRSLFYEQAVSLDRGNAKQISNWLLGDATRILKENHQQIDASNLTPENLVCIIQMINNKTISGSAAKLVLETTIKTGENPDKIVNTEGLVQVNDDDELIKIIKDVLKNNTKAVQDYINGKDAVIGFLVGQCMRQSKGKANPEKIKSLIKNVLQEKYQL